MSSIFFKDKMYTRHGEMESIVSVESFDGQTLVRSRKENPDGTVADKYVANGKTHRKTGRNLPPEVIQQTRVYPIKLSDGSLLRLHIQTQHAGKFLLSDSEYSEAFRARVTSLSGAEMLDRASMDAASEHRGVKSKLTLATEETLPELEKTLSGYETLKTELDSLKKWKETRIQLGKRLEKLNLLKSKKLDLDCVGKTVITDRSKELALKKKILNNLLVYKLMLELKNVSKPILIPDIPNVSNVLTIMSHKSKMEQLLENKRQISNLTMSHYLLGQQLSTKRKKLYDLLEGMGECPTCGK